MPTPERLGKYEIVRTIGKGGFGVVQEGYDPHLKRRVAIKTCTREEEDVRKRFFREAEISGRLQHRRIVTVYDFGTEDGVPYLVQEYLPGEDLRDKIERSDDIPDTLKLEYLAQVAEGLEYAHAQGVVHRDVKPANIRILGDGNVKIMDFGIAKLSGAASKLTDTGMALGTASYLPPEQIKGDSVGPRADIFSYGVVAYELLSGRRPFRGDDLSAIMFQILGRDPVPLVNVWPQCPPRLSALVGKCLAKDPDHRHASFTVVLKGLSPILEEFRARPAPPMPMPRATGGVTPQADEPERSPERGSLPTQVLSREDLFAREAEKAAKRVQGLIEQGDFDQAEEALAQALDRYGNVEPLSAVGTRLAGVRREQRTAETKALFAKAGALEKAGQLEEAQGLLREVLDSGPHGEEAKRALARVTAGLQKRAEDERRQKAVAQAVDNLEAAVATGDLRGAQELLSRFERELGTAPFRVVRQRVAGLEKERREQEQQQKELERQLEEDRRQRTVAAAVASAVSSVESAADKGDVRAARELLSQFEREMGTAPFRVVRQRLVELQKQRSDEERRQQELDSQLEEDRRQKAVASAVSSVESAADKGDLRAARELLSQFEREIGTAPFRVVRKRIAELDRKFKQQPQPKDSPREEARPEDGPPAPKDPEKQGSTPRESEPRTRSPAPRTGESPGPLPRGRWAGLMLMFLGLAVVGSFALWNWLRDGSGTNGNTVPTTPTTTTTSTTTLVAAPTVAPPPQSGRLVLDALPWAEVSDVVDTAGTRWPVGPIKYTPLMLILPAGEYTVTFRNPQLPAPISRQVKVRASETDHLVAELRRVDPVAYFSRSF